MPEADLKMDIPKTLTAYQSEIMRLLKRTATLEAENQALANNLRRAERKLEEIEDEQDARDTGAVAAINQFLDECERIGPLRFDVPQSNRAQSAIIHLHDVVGRQP